MVTKTAVNLETSHHMKTAPVLCLTLFISCFILSTQHHARGMPEMSAPEKVRNSQAQPKRPKYYSLVVPLLPLKCDISLDTEGVFNPKEEEGIILRASSYRIKLKKGIQR